MKPSRVVDTDGAIFPDPLINMNVGSLTQIPTEYRVTSRDLTRWWVAMYELYGMLEYDDLLLNINGCRYLTDLHPGDLIYKPAVADLTGFLENKQIGYEDE